MINLITIILDKLNQPQIKLNSNEILFLRDTISSKAFIFKDLTEEINKIIDSKTISLEMFLKIILLVINNYKNFITPDEMVVDIVNIIKFTLDIIVQVFSPDQIISIPVESLINYSLTLLVTELQSKTVTTWFSKLKCCCYC